MPKKATKIIDFRGEEVVANEEYYLNNPNLPKNTTTYTYTPAMIKEIARCKKDIIYFAENHFYIISALSGQKEHITLFEKQKKILKTIQRNKKTLLISSRQWGKCLSPSVPICVRYKPLNLSFKINVGIFFKLIKLQNKLKKFINKITFKNA